MKSRVSIKSGGRKSLVNSLAIALSLALAGCASGPPVPVTTLQPEGAGGAGAPALGVLSPLVYYQMLSRMTPAELGRERMVLAALPSSPNTQVRQAMLFGHPRTQFDMARAISLLEAVMKSTDSAAIDLQPLAKLLADNYAERQKMEAHLERQGGQLKESQRKVIELQEKIDGLANIELNLPPRPRAVRPAGPGSAR